MDQGMTREQIESYVKDPGRLLGDIDLQLEQVAVEDLPIITLDGDQQIERGVSDGRPKHSVMEVLLIRSQEKLRVACCEKLGYCKARKEHSDTVALIQVVGNSLLSAHVGFPLPLVTVVSYCVLSMFLDRMCDCP